MALESCTAAGAGAGACHRCGLAWRYCPFCGEEQRRRLDHPQNMLVTTTKPCVPSLAEICPSICWSDRATLTGKKSKAAGCKSAVQAGATTTAATTSGTHRNRNVTDYSLIDPTVTGAVRAHGASEGSGPSAKAVSDTALSDGAAVLQHLLQVAREEWRAAAGSRPVNPKKIKKGEPCDERDEEHDAFPREKQKKKDGPVHPDSSWSCATRDRDAAPWSMDDHRWQLSGFELFCWEESTRAAACQYSVLSAPPLLPPRVSQGRLTMAARRALAQKWLTATLSLKSTYESLAMQWRSIVSDQQHGQPPSQRSSSFSPQAPPRHTASTTVSTPTTAAAGPFPLRSPPAAAVSRSCSCSCSASASAGAVSNITRIIPASKSGEEADLLTRNKRTRGEEGDNEEQDKEEQDKEEGEQVPNHTNQRRYFLSIGGTDVAATAATVGRTEGERTAIREGSRSRHRRSSSTTTTTNAAITITTGVEGAPPRSRAPVPPRLYREIRGVVTSYGIFYGEQRSAGVGVKRIRDMWEAMTVECKHRYDEEAASRRYRIEAARLQQRQEQEESLKQK